MTERSVPEAGGALYLDASALVKLVVEEAESAALAEAIEGGAILSSQLSLAEVPRAVRRIGGGGGKDLFERLNRLLRRLDLFPVTRDLLLASAELPDPGLRAMDAIHIATALRVCNAIEALVTYDRRQRTSAEAAGLRILAPA